MPRGDHTLKDSQQSVVSHSGHHPKNWVSGVPTAQGTVQSAGTSKQVAYVADAVTSVCVLAKPAVPGDVTAAQGLAYSVSVFYDNILPSVLWPPWVVLSVFVFFLFAENARRCVLSAVYRGLPWC